MGGCRTTGQTKENWDISKWNVKGQRHAFVFQALKARSARLCLQEVRTPLDIEVMTTYGYTTMMPNAVRKESKNVTATCSDRPSDGDQMARQEWDPNRAP